MLRLKQIRVANGKTQEAVSAYLRIARASYANIENGKRDPDTQTIIALADYFDVTIDELFGRQSNKQHSFSEKELLFLHRFNLLNNENKENILENMDFLLSKQNKNASQKTAG